MRHGKKARHKKRRRHVKGGGWFNKTFKALAKFQETGARYVKHSKAFAFMEPVMQDQAKLYRQIANMEKKKKKKK